MQLQPLTESGSVGRFVPRGTPGALDSPQRLSVARRDLSKAQKIQALSQLALSPDAFVDYLSHPDVATVMVGRSTFQWVPQPRPQSGAHRTIREFQVLKNGRAYRKGIAILSRGRELPRRPMIHSALQERGGSLALVFSKHTTRHFSVILLRLEGGHRFSIR